MKIKITIAALLASGLMNHSANAEEIANVDSAPPKKCNVTCTDASSQNTIDFSYQYTGTSSTFDIMVSKLKFNGSKKTGIINTTKDLPTKNSIAFEILNNMEEDNLSFSLGAFGKVNGLVCAKGKTNGVLTSQGVARSKPSVMECTISSS